jgi:hypothetical protein
MQPLEHLELFKPLELSLARVAKLVDAPSSGGGVRKDVLVRIQSRALDSLVND